MPPNDAQTHPRAADPELPEWAQRAVGTLVTWQETEGADETPALVLGARWARDVDGKPLMGGYVAVQFLLERVDGSSRWSAPQLAPEGTVPA